MVHLSFHQQMTNKLRLVSPAANECGRMASPDSGKASDFNVSKAKYARRRRFEIRRLKSLYQQNDELAGGNLETHSGEDRCAKKRQLENKEIASHASKHEDCPEKQAWETSSSSSSSSSSDHSLENDVVPVRTSSSKSVTCLSHGSVSVIGRRREMEDAITVKQGFVTGDSREYDFFGVYDGHGGSRVAHACREQLHQVVAREIDEWVKTTSSWGRRDGDQIDWERLMVASFGKMDEEVNSKRFEEVKTVGSTAVVAVVGKEEVVVANCGDCRAVLCRGGVAVPLSNDHKPDRPDELERIEAAGGRVINWNGQRVLGVLATSRSIGDQYLKPFVISVPEVTVSKRTETDEFLILASDGLWDVISNEIACKVVRRCLTGRMRRRPQEFVNEKISHELVNYSRAVEAAAVLTELAMAKGSKDNISVIVVELKKLSNLKFHPSVQL